MRYKQLSQHIMLSVGLLLAAMNSYAAPYLVLEIGQARGDSDLRSFRDYNAEIIGQGGQATLSDDNRDRALLLGIGYQYTSALALELSYIDLGKNSATSRSTDISRSEVIRTRMIRETAEQRGLLFSAVGQYRMNEHWHLKGRLGFAWLDQTASGFARGQSVNAAGTVIAAENESFRKSGHEWAPMIGLGVGYLLTSDWQLGLNWRRVLNTDPDALGEYNLDALMAGIGYRF
ncbi:outer membrane protein [Oceanospirillum linum]|uniref:Outer membrane protein beta-barrel domain-containing protein n=1 Tax=Oceanospirillum linum TaxID=966 RepID=A0A1T1HBB4_OCELI|nr:outer membrane beta-barrel protein [Oceanospirillum linum]OOV87158.1 hypothetical protein BTA35_0209185 [Oceanospirillum linum]SEF76444.1 Outer membrane protein beta-barrel domain-containing protein [Oleiphilus messinensis]SMP17518.1 Outer membrane protein beta-barrel domain-containing protein [Oceanospirillum linum]